MTRANFLPGRGPRSTALIAFAGCATQQAVSGPARSPDAQARSLQDRLASLQAQLQGQDRHLAETCTGQTATLSQNALNQAMQGVRRVEGKTLLSVTLTKDRARYPLNLDELDARDVRRLDELVARLASLGDNYHLKIQGHSDDNGAVEYNYLLAEAHANAVAGYLHGRGGVPLQRMSVISYGASRAPAGQARLVDAGNNQRVEIRVVRQQSRGLH